MSDSVVPLWFYFTSLFGVMLLASYLCGRRLAKIISLADAQLKAEREKALREAAEVCERVRTQKANGPMPEGACFDYEQSILAIIKKDATDV